MPIKGSNPFLSATLCPEEGFGWQATEKMIWLRVVLKGGVPLEAPWRRAGVAKLVDALDLGSSDESHGGSSPSARTSLRERE